MQGGSFLGTSRGGFDVGKIADAIQYRGLNQVYIIGGDGAHRGAQTLFDEVVGRRRLKVAIGECLALQSPYSIVYCLQQCT
jgi:6-phosphofructokinase 1